MYSITYMDGKTPCVTEAEDPTRMREVCEELASNTRFKNIRVWMLVHTVEAETKVVWKDHARGITGGV